MVLYLLKKHIVYSLLASIVVILVWITFGPAVATTYFTSVRNMLIQGCFVGSLAGTYLTYIYFRKKNLWILYHNLRINGYWVLLVSFIIYQLVMQTLIITIAG